MSDLTTTTLHAAMRGLATRQRTIADNIANIETPGFRAGRVSFEDSLRAAVEGGNPSSSAVTTSRSTDPTLPNGNNVNLDDETLAMVDNNLRYQLASEAISAKYRLLRSAMANR